MTNHPLDGAAALNDGEGPRNNPTPIEIPTAAVHTHAERCCPRIPPGVSQLICTNAAQVQPSLRKCSLK
jgi:hypothetical protein